ncbi:hypothetical protein IWQ47_000373 [Aquimarina sp. EL_43]|uniref:DUF6122 family protein n=1 Tax=Aquimarina TaxID=290174 RepID=UPI000472ADB8|nr:MULTISPECIES: DUF6122 family protein [Aquimarina]MBG6128934.1 hypothetical protein [Aquimarina sp. EL_35]MBG6149998.1 hypothetical protein [Aquimarina sp. EL_32]MBG6167315.1 hypothetical protein [Aquimarina sp. EL_43]
MIRPILHYGFHFIIPLLIAILFFPKQWKKVYILFIAAMLIDIDHLLADPIFDSNRCSIGYHPLHSYYAIAVYGILSFFSKTRIIGLALIWHILTDCLDCLMM